jgi:hypothetical protein
MVRRARGEGNGALRKAGGFSRKRLSVTLSLRHGGKHQEQA